MIAVFNVTFEGWTFPFRTTLDSIDSGLIRFIAKLPTCACLLRSIFYFVNSKAQGTILKVIALLLEVNVTLVSDFIKLP